ncbi:MAG: hypothetical protein SO230_08435, partial [Sodaliphilus sp.]|nr:hypothetical protein [Sodaliphilus sp.]
TKAAPPQGQLSFSLPLYHIWGIIRINGKFVGINYELLPNRDWNQKQKHKKQPWGKVECFAFGPLFVRVFG